MDLFTGANVQTYGPLSWRPEDIFADSRKFGNPDRSRFVKLQNATPDGGAFSFSKDFGKTVIVGRETLRLLTVSDPNVAGMETGDSQQSAIGKPTTSSVGPGGSRVDIGQNFWPSKFRAIHQMTDVTWGPENFNNKVFTSCSNGEVMSWDFAKGGLKQDASLSGSARSVNVVTSATYSAYNIATGSNDGSVKLWDLRHPRNPAFNLLSHGSAVRSLTFGQTTSLPVHVVLGLESGMIFRYDLRMRIEYLDRIIAHTACVHDLAWLPPSKDDTCAGYLASGSFDHTVKIWQIEPARISMKPLHTLHTPYPVGKIDWRPSFPTEIVVLPYHSGATGKSSTSASVTPAASNERFAPQVWDVRNGWLAKWGISPLDGPATDMLVTDPYAVHLLYRSGSFAQHDLHTMTRPYDLIRRQALSWNANSNLFFVADKPRRFDPPYDDLHPSFAPMLPDHGMLDKHPGDRLSTMKTQIIGTEHIETALDRDSYMKLARGYNHHDTDKVQMCKTNEEVATRAGQHDIAQTWALLGSLLSEFTTLKKVDMPTQPQSSTPLIPPSEMPLSATEPPSATKSMSSPPFSAQSRAEDVGSGFSLDGFGASAVKRKGSGGAAMLTMQLAQHQKRRGSSPSLLSATRPGGKATRSPSSSPASQPMKLPITTMSMSYNPSSMIRPHLPRRVSISSGGNSHSHSPGPKVDTKSGWAVHSVVADGALSGSSDEEESGGGADDAVVHSEASVSTSWSKEKRKVSKLGLQHPTLHSSSSSASPSPRVGGTRPLPPSHLVGTKAALLSHNNSRLASPQSQLLNIQDVNEEDLDEEGATDEEDDSVSHSSASSLRHRNSSDDGSHHQYPIDVPLDLHALAQQSPPSPTLAKFAAKSNDSSRTTTIGRGGAGLKILTKHDSDGSSTTAYQMVSVGYVGSFGSTMMTPTIGRMGIGSLAGPVGVENSAANYNQSTGASKELTSMDIVGHGSGRGGAKPGSSPTTLPKSLSNLFTSPIVPKSASTVQTPSTNAPPSATRPTVTRNTSFGSRANRAHGTLMSMSSAAPPVSAGPEHGSFAMVRDVEKGEEKSVWKDEHEELVRVLEEEERNGMWEIMKECLDEYADEGNVQMCAALAMAAHRELGLTPDRLERFVVAYLDQLMRMQLHLNAAYIRHVSPIESLNNSATTNIFNYLTCGTCGKMIDGNGPPETAGRYAYCERCKSLASRCAICHLPVRRMLLFCHACGHGGHQKCYQEFYTRQPPVCLDNPQGKFPHSRSEDVTVESDVVNLADVEGVNGDMVEVGTEEKGLGLGIDMPRGRRSIKKGASEGVEAPDAIPEKEPINFTTSTTSSRGPLFGHVPAHPPNDRRSSSLADTSTIMEDKGLPDEEYILVREKEAVAREAEKADMKLLGHLCAAGCGHICWMTRS